MASLGKRLDAVEEGLIENMLLEVLVQREIRELLRALEASEDIDDGVYDEVVGILANAGYIEGEQL